MTENEIAKIIVDAAFQIHKGMGPGLLESVYEVVLAHALKKRGLKIERQVPVAIVFDGIRFDEGFRAYSRRYLKSHQQVITFASLREAIL